MEQMYSDYRDELETGDVLLYSGEGTVSRAIQYGQWLSQYLGKPSGWFEPNEISKWSHVGMVVRVPEIDLLLVYQSTTLSKIKDYVDGVAKQGVQVNLLSDSIENYNGDIAVRRLAGVTRGIRFNDTLRAFRAEMKDRPYEESKRELINAAYDGPFGHNEEDLSSLFCSELLAEIYQRWELLDDSKPSNEYTPKDFADPNLQLRGSAHFLPTKYLKYTGE